MCAHTFELLVLVNMGTSRVSRSDAQVGPARAARAARPDSIEPAEASHRVQIRVDPRREESQGLELPCNDGNSNKLQNTYQDKAEPVSSGVPHRQLEALSIGWSAARCSGRLRHDADLGRRTVG
jgi:hypothetical protein